MHKLWSCAVKYSSTGILLGVTPDKRSRLTVFEMYLQNEDLIYTNGTIFIDKSTYYIVCEQLIIDLFACIHKKNTGAV